MTKDTFQANLSVTFLREKKRFIAYSPALDFSTSGKSFEEAKEKAQEVLELWLEELTSRNKKIPIRKSRPIIDEIEVSVRVR
jgi:predicted RNase H-like HicB family nuclease